LGNDTAYKPGALRSEPLLSKRSDERNRLQKEELATAAAASLSLERCIASTHEDLFARACDAGHSADTHGSYTSWKERSRDAILSRHPPAPARTGA